MIKNYKIFLFFYIQFIYYALIFSLDIQNLNFYYKPIYYPLDNKRSTSSEILLPGIIPLGNSQNNSYLNNQLQQAYSFIFNNLQQYRSEFILYPEPFTFQNEFFSQGAIITTNTQDLSGNFEYLVSSSNISINNSKALYGSNIAVLSIYGMYDGTQTELTWESVYYCNVMNDYLGVVDICYTSSEYLQYKPYGTSFVYVNENDIQNGILLNNDSTPAFGLFIIPDIFMGEESVIINKLTSTGLQNINNYVKNGGSVYISAKGVAIATAANLISSSIVDTSSTLYVPNQLVNVSCMSGTGINGFVEEAACFYVPEQKNLLNVSIPYSQIVSPYVLINPSTNDPSLIPIVNFGPDVTLYQQDSSGNRNLLSSSQTSQQSVVYYKLFGQGQIIFSQAQTVFPTDTLYPWFFNSFFILTSRQIIFNLNIIGQPIPALESGVIVGASLQFFNLFQYDLSSFNLIFSISEGIEIKNYPSSCSFNTSTNNSICLLDTFSGFETVEWIFSMEITNPLVTQSGTATLAFLNLTYINTNENNRFVNLVIGSLTSPALLAPLIRADLNPDPSSFYPLPGPGIYIDDVLVAENTVNSEAYDVVFTTFVPLITPLVDISSQSELVHTATFYPDYYNKSVNQIKNFYYPFGEPNCPNNTDIIDYAQLVNKGVVLCSDWDCPVKPKRIPRSSINAPTVSTSGNDSINNITNANLVESIPNLGVDLEQIYFPDAQKFYTTASPRQLVFVDPTTLGGAQSLDSSATSPQPKNLVFSRVDIHFYELPGGNSNLAQYPLPIGINNSTIMITVDRYPGNKQTGGAEILVEGCFGNYPINGNTCPYPHYIPNQYNNGLIGSGKIVYNYSSPTFPSNLKTTYLFPLGGIYSYSDFANFNSLNSNGYYGLTGYEDLVYLINMHTYSFSLDDSSTRLGGRFIINLGTYSLPSTNITDLVFYSADEVAFTNTTYNSSENSIYCYFKRGNLPYEDYGPPSQLMISISGIGSTSNITLIVIVQELTYDLTLATKELYTTVYTNNSANFVYTSFLSLPAVKMQFKLSNGPYKNESNIPPYGWLQPFARYGLYYQELLMHTTAYGSSQINPQTIDPGIVTVNGAFSVIGNIGESSIPFRQYLTTGASQVIPLTSETSRIDWTDYWGRRWVQPIRSVFVDAAPLPGPLRNFMLTQTFEILDENGNRMLEWSSDDVVDVFVQMKLLNDYEKFFAITDCANNEIVIDETTGNKYNSTNIQYPILGLNFPAEYGSCWDSGDVWVNGQQLSSSQLSEIQNIYLCQNYTYGCPDLKNLPILTIRPNSSTPIYWWNYSPSVNSFYPEYYISNSMWSLTEHDYMDNVFGLAYPWHFDNVLPGLDSKLIAPQNVIAAPILKGYGYSMTYSATHSNPKFPGKQGWWSNNLQNRDSTLLAGQSTVNNISVIGPDLTEGLWVPLTELNGENSAIAKEMVSDALKNIYVCLFNRYRINTQPNNSKIYYPTNVYINNIIPLFPNILKTSPESYDYMCNISQPAYFPNNISLANNYLPTSNLEDWLYFAANLRAQARETINLLTTMSPIPNVVFEGTATVFGGARFVYWNPANGPNSFLVVDGPPNYVKAIRNNLTLNVDVFPTMVNTFNSTIYQVLNVLDSPECNRTYTDSVYYNYYGFGDSAVGIYVGEYGTSCILSPGDTTVAAINFFNNAGFDWNLLVDAINFTYDYSVPLSAYYLLKEVTEAIPIPLAYNFMTLDIPPELSPYITIEPYQGNAGVAPMLFDFSYINVATIRDGFQGSYFYNITLSSNIPENITGRLWSINVTLNEQYFESLPSYNDPTGNYHDYHLQIPPLVIGIPYQGPITNWTGNVYYVNGYATNLTLVHQIPTLLQPQQAKAITYEQLEQIRSIVADVNQMDSKLEQFFESLPGNNISFIIGTPINGIQNVYFNMSTQFQQFPIPNPGYQGPPTCSYYLIVKQYAPQLPFGTDIVTDNLIVDFNNWRGNFQQTPMYPPIRTVQARGPWIIVGYTGVLVGPASFQPLVNQVLDRESVSSNSNSAAKITIRYMNSGSDIAYNVNLTVNLALGVSIITNKISIPFKVVKNSEGTESVELFVNSVMEPGVFFSTTIYVEFSLSSIFIIPGISRYSNNGGQTIIGEALIINSVNSTLDLSPELGSEQVTEFISQQYLIPVSNSLFPTVTLQGQSIGSNQLKLIATPANINVSSNILYDFRRRDNDPIHENMFYTRIISKNPIVTDTLNNASVSLTNVSYIVLLIDSSNTSINYISNYSIMAESNIWTYAPTSSSFPGWGIALIVLGILGLLGAGIAAFFLLRKKRKPETYENPNDEDYSLNIIMNKKPSTSPQKLLEESTPIVRPKSDVILEGKKWKEEEDKMYQVDADQMITTLPPPPPPPSARVPCVPTTKSVQTKENITIPYKKN